MSWESTVPYYRRINEAVGERLGGLHSAKIILASVDFAEIEAFQRAEEWDRAGSALAETARGLERAGADFVVIATNTMHRVAPAVEAAISVPLLHIADATAARIKAAGLNQVGLLGTRFTMEQTFYRDRLSEMHGIDVIVPGEGDRALVHRVIYTELCCGKILDESRNEFRRIIAGLAAGGAEGVILGCTEIALLVSADDAPVPVFDTGDIHAVAAAEMALEG